MPKTASKYQPGGNYTKLMKEMKCSIDTQLYLGVLNPISLGLLVKGFKATLFQMKLLSDGVYIPMAFDRFSLVEEIHELVQLPSVVEAFCLVKSELRKFVENISTKSTKEERKAGRERVYPSFETNFVSKKTN